LRRLARHDSDRFAGDRVQERRLAGARSPVMVKGLIKIRALWRAWPNEDMNKGVHACGSLKESMPQTVLQSVQVLRKIRRSSIIARSLMEKSQLNQELRSGFIGRKNAALSRNARTRLRAFMKRSVRMVGYSYKARLQNTLPLANPSCE
jgi:hypothetical protein